jgi:hypothetical protein
MGRISYIRAEKVAILAGCGTSAGWGVCVSYTVKKAAWNSDVENGGANQTTWGSENSYSHVFWFCATVVNIGIWRIPTWLFYSVRECHLLQYYGNETKMNLFAHCKKKFREIPMWTTVARTMGVRKFLLPRRLVRRHRCQHRKLAHSDMVFSQCRSTIDIIAALVCCAQLENIYMAHNITYSICRH